MGKHFRIAAGTKRKTSIAFQHYFNNQTGTRYELNCTWQSRA